MTMTDKLENDKTELDAAFAQMRQNAPVASEALLARVMADAETVIEERNRNVENPRKSRSLWAEIGAAIGGWTAVAGLGTATIAGVWIGFVQPESFSPVSDMFISEITTSSLDDFMPGLNSMASGG